MPASARLHLAPSAQLCTLLRRNPTPSCVLARRPDRPPPASFPTCSNTIDFYPFCCDGIWLPSFNFKNVVAFPQDRLQPYTVYFGGNGEVMWETQIHGTYFQVRAARLAAPLPPQPPPLAQQESAGAGKQNLGDGIRTVTSAGSERLAAQPWQRCLAPASPRMSPKGTDATTTKTPGVIKRKSPKLDAQDVAAGWGLAPLLPPPSAARRGAAGWDSTGLGGVCPVQSCFLDSSRTHHPFCRPLMGSWASG